MSQDIIRLEYDKAEDMVRAFQQGSQQLQDMMQAMQKVASTLEQGALLGDGGQQFVESLQNKLNPTLDKLNEQFNKLAEDVKYAIKLMREADEQSAQAAHR